MKDSNDDDICWVSQINKYKEQRLRTSDESPPTATNQDHHRATNDKTEGAVGDLKPKRLFSDQEFASSGDFDAQVIKKQEKTFEELLES